MFVICDVDRPLSDAFYIDASFIPSVLTFYKLFSQTKSVLVYKDLQGKRRLADLVFCAKITKSDCRRIKSSIDHTSPPSTSK